MATASRVHFTSKDVGECSVNGLTEESAIKVSELLQKNHDENHIYFRGGGFHNHVAHYMPTIFALGASPNVIEKHYRREAAYQRPLLPLDERVLEDLHDPSKFFEYLADEKYYRDYLVYFQEEIGNKGYQDVVNEYLFKGDKRADYVLGVLLAGFLHPILHLGFAIEFNQPALVAEALAQAATHDPYLNPFFVESEKKAKARKGLNHKSLVTLIDEIQHDETMTTAARLEDDQGSIQGGILVRANEEMINYASQWSVKPEDLEERTAEMMNFGAYYTGAAQHPPKQVKMDFFSIHAPNCAIFFSSFLKQPWLSTANKVRLLEWKGRVDLVLYVSRGCPPLRLSEIVNYTPREPGNWASLFHRVLEYDDDGHASKLVRALAHGERICAPYDSNEDFRIKRAMWLQLGHMAVDSVTDTGPTWVRSAGFEGAWAKFEDRPRAAL